MHLHTFGGLSIEAGAGDGPAPSIGPRRLALLAIVAAAGARGITREKVVGILWPESDEEQARHTLSQTLYLLRREAGDAWVAGSTQLRLAASITSDVVQLQDALSAGQLERAAALYAGPFLDGFYLAGAPAFEQWVEETRARLQSGVRRALETLARSAVAAGAHREAAGWWQRLLELDPFNSAYAAGRVRALGAAGDHAHALSVARAYEARVRHELDDEPDPAIGALIEQLRELVPPTSEPAAIAHRVRSDATASAPMEQESGAPRVPVATRRSLWLKVAFGAAAVLVLGVLGWRAAVARTSPADTLPFLAIGTIEARDTASLGLILRDVLATTLGRVSGLRVVSNTRLLELLPQESASAAATTDAARRAGASEIIEGELAASSAGLMLTLRRVAIRTGQVLQGYTVRAPDVFALTDSATIAIAHDFGLDPPAGSAATVRTRSAVAYALYEQGLRAFYSSDYPAAAQLMYAALGRDSTFAMAAAYAWRTSLDMSRFEEAMRDLPVVRRLAARAPERERLLIETLIADYGGEPLSTFLAAARRLTDRYPEEPDGHVLLGRALFDAGEWREAVAAFDRAVAIDSAAAATGPYCRICDALIGAHDAYLWFDSAAAAERTARRLIHLRPRDAAGWGLLIEPLLRQGRRAEAEAAIATAARIGGGARVNYSATKRDLIRSGRLDELEQGYLAEVRTTPPELVSELPWLLGILLRNQGRLRAAGALAGAGMVPGTDRRLPGHHDATTLAIVALEAGRPREAARRFLDMTKDDRTRAEGPGFVARNLSWHMTLAATAAAEAGDTALVRALADSVQRIGRRSSIARDYRLHHFLHGLLLQRQGRHGDAVEAFRRSILSLTDGYTRINVELARSLVALQRYPDAIAVLQPALRGGVDGANTYVTHTALHEALAHAFHAAGQADSARVHYAAVERAWRRADPQFRARYDLARTRAASVP